MRTVLFVPDWYPSPSNPEAGVFNRRIATSLATFARVAVLSLNNRHESAPAIFLCTHGDFVQARLGQGRFTRWPMIGSFEVTRLLRDARLLVEHSLGCKVDLIHATDLSAVLTTKAWPKTPQVLTHHWTGLATGGASWMQRAHVRLAWPKCRAIMSVNQDAGYLGQYAGDTPVHWVPNVLDEDVFHSDEKGVDERSLTVVHASLFGPLKRTADVIRAFKKVLQRVPARLLMFGDGPERQSTQALAEAILPERSFLFPGKVLPSQLGEAFRRASVMLLPSSFETFGCVAMEAAACGCYVVSTGVGGLAGVVTPEMGAEVVVGDVDAMAECVASILGGEKVDLLKRDEMARHVRSQFGRFAVGRRIQTVYNEVMP